MQDVGRLVMLLFFAMPLQAADSGSPLMPGAYAGRWDYDGRYTNTWSIVIDKVNDDGSFIGKITYYGVNCHARNAPILNGKVDSGEVRFSADFGFRCTGVAFLLRKGSAHALEGELKTDSARLPGKVWLDREK